MPEFHRDILFLPPNTLTHLSRSALKFHSQLPGEYTTQDAPKSLFRLGPNLTKYFVPVNTGKFVKFVKLSCLRFIAKDC